MKLTQPGTVESDATLGHTIAATKQIIDNQIKSRAPVTGHIISGIGMQKLCHLWCNAKVFPRHAQVNWIVVHAHDFDRIKQSLELTDDRPGARPQQQYSPRRPGWTKQRRQPKQVPDTAGEGAALAVLAVQHTVAVEPQT